MSDSKSNREKINKTLLKFEKLGLDVSAIPSEIRDSAYEICTGSGVSMTLEMGFLLDEDVELVKALSELMPAIKVVTSKPDLLALRNELGKAHVGFTHLNGYWEDQIFYVLYALPANYAFEHLR
ncbi:conserved hypothetical protein [Vibrio chagasii]|nr:conserved hypothetical protein [Vibrio chagasii]